MKLVILLVISNYPPGSRDNIVTLDIVQLLTRLTFENTSIIQINVLLFFFHSAYVVVQQTPHEASVTKAA